MDDEITKLEAALHSLNTDLEQIQKRIDDREIQPEGNGENQSANVANQRMPNESRRDFLIRTGKITPFSKLPHDNLVRHDSSLEGALLDAEIGDADTEPEESGVPTAEALSHRNLVQPGFVDRDDESNSDFERDSNKRKKRRKLHRGLQPERHRRQSDTDSDQISTPVSKADAVGSPDSDDPWDRDSVHSSDTSIDDDNSFDSDGSKSTRRTSKRTRSEGREHRKSEKVNLAGVDDGNEAMYQKRLRTWMTRRSEGRARGLRRNEAPRELTASHLPVLQDTSTDEPLVEKDMEWHLPHPAVSDAVVEESFRIPGDIYPSLFDYQKTGVRWLWELYSQKVGGIVGDEMGLGKTIQIIAFLAGLHYSKKMTKPVLIVAPPTVMKQWVNEFHTWWPPFRVSILHSSGSGMIDVGRENAAEDSLLSQLPSSRGKTPMTKAMKSAKKIVDRVQQEGHILVTTYSGLQTYASLLIPTEWEYAVLDEGHKIRNPNISITIYCKELRTANRVILSGTPMQNNLVELWSLFDFIFPMRLGTLVNFRQQFEFPIRLGGYANATNLQVQTALRCAETLKDAISPYLLQRFKADVASDLPKKSEQVLFCKLTRTQREAYENFLASDDLKAIMSGKRQVLFGIDILRKICNHPDLQEHNLLSKKTGYNYGSGTKSGKMQVVEALLELWKEQGHRTLLFAQHRIMLDILERFIRSMPGFNYRRMDGNTPIQSRQSIVDEFNSNSAAHVFLLTTKVGGLGVNLTGANRVIIFDPDWNPSTDIQARERAWRLGQKREVMIYRLMTSGTIEEKIYHRQLFKQFLINKILRDPKQRQTFQMKDLHDLFTLGGADDNKTETGGMFKGAEVEFKDHDPATKPPPESSSSSLTINTGPREVIGSAEKSLNGVASIENYEGEQEAERSIISADAVNSEARMMESIFARSGVHAALEHDQIVNGRRSIAADPQMIEQEAKRVAAQAAKELKKAGEAAKNVPVGTPTWTGQFGIAGRPEEQRRGLGRGRGGPSSVGILAGLQQRQANDASLSNSRSSTPGSAAPGPRGRDFMKMIRDYLVVQGGQVHTQMLIDHFNRFCNTPDRTAEFKAMLTEIATLQKGARGRGRWMLKEEYR